MSEQTSLGEGMNQSVVVSVCLVSCSFILQQDNTRT